MVKTNFLRKFFMLVVFTALPMLLYSQPPGMGGMHQYSNPFSPEEDGKMKETIHTVMLIDMTKFVGLSNKQALEISPILDQIAGLKEDHKRNQRENFEKLESLVELKGKDKEIKSILELLKSREKEFRNKDFELREKVLVGLTTVQQAKMVLFQVHFREKMREIMGNARRFEKRKRIMEERKDHLKKINEKKGTVEEELPEPPPEDEDFVP
ncbi:hypothetical protein KKB18_11765 [bacterium]|nr:hypothetical protein [bacterium]